MKKEDMNSLLSQDNFSDSDAVIVQDSEFSQDRVPLNRRQSFWQLFFVMVGFTFFSPSMITGGQLGIGLNFRDFVLAVLIGNGFLALYTGLLAHISQKSGLNLDLLAKKTFGSSGSVLSSALVSFTQTGWFGVGVAMFALPVAGMFGINKYLLILVTGLLMTLTAVLGIKALSIFGAIAVPLIAILGSYSSALSIKEVGGWASIFSDNPAQPLTLTVAIGMVIANFVSGGTSTPNFTRFGKTSKQAVWATVIAFFFGNILMISFGAIGASVYNEADIFNVLIIQGLMIPAILTLGLNIWSTNNNALYTAGLGVSNITKLPIKYSTAIMGVIGTVTAIILYENFTSFLTLLGTFIPPVGAVIIIHYFLNKDDVSTGKFGQEYRLNIAAIVAVVVGALAAFLIPVGIAAINGLLISAVAYLVLVKVMPSLAHKK